MKSIRITRLSFGLRLKGGRSRGLITAPRRGGLIKKIYRFLDTKRTLYSEKGALILNQYLYDPNRSGLISLIMYPNGILTYILAANFPETQIKVLNLAPPQNPKDKGWSNYLKFIPLGSILYNLEIFPNSGARIVRTAGNSAVLLRKAQKLTKHVLIKLKSGEHRLFNENCLASIGIVSNGTFFLRNYRHAGVRRRYGIRPRVRPSAMNPVDHPMAGRTRGGCAPQSRTGKLSLGTSPLTKKNHHLILVTARKSRKHRIS